jgi:predicted N-acetyltransferase YhbS
MTTTWKKYQLRLIDESQMTATMDAAIRDLLCDCFPDDISVFGKTRHWHASAPTFSLVHEQKSRVVGHVGVVVRLIRCGNVPVSVAGIQNLAVRPELRSCGLGRQLMSESMAKAKLQGISWGVLFCVPQLEKFYQSLDWRTVHTTVRMNDERGINVQIPAKNICMAICLRSIPFPGGAIDLRGADW